jgi:trimethylguanosine synthase
MVDATVEEGFPMSDTVDLQKILAKKPDWTEGQRVGLGKVLKALDGQVNVGKALVKIGLRRKRADRFMARKAPLDTALVEEMVRLNGFLEAAVMRQDDAAKDAAAAIVEVYYPSGEVLAVNVRLEGPDWLDPAIWIPEGVRGQSTRVRPHHARWLLQYLHGLTVGECEIQVHCEPEIRAGKRPQHRVPDVQRKKALFSRWFEGIQWDEEGLFSLTPQTLAKDMVKDLNGVVVDATCGLGALSIAAARNENVERVIAMDCDAKRLQMAAHNAGLYGVQDRIEFREGRAEDLIQGLAHDALLLDPPWGGVDYDKKRVGVSDLAMPIEAILGGVSGRVLLKLPRSFALSTLPGEWTIRPAVNTRGILKFLIAERS